MKGVLNGNSPGGRTGVTIALVREELLHSSLLIVHTQLEANTGFYFQDPALDMGPTYRSSHIALN